MGYEIGKISVENRSMSSFFIIYILLGFLITNPKSNISQVRFQSSRSITIFFINFSSRICTYIKIDCKL